MNEAIEVVVESFNFNADDQDEPVNSMNPSVSTEGGNYLVHEDVVDTIIPQEGNSLSYQEGQV